MARRKREDELEENTSELTEHTPVVDPEPETNPANVENAIAEESEVDDLAGTVEGQARDYFEKEKEEYEKRTGQSVYYVPPMPVTRTPIESETSDAPESADSNTEETQSEGDA